MRINALRTTVITLIILSMAGCIAQPVRQPLTAEELQMRQEMIARFQQRMMGGQQNQQPVQKPQPQVQQLPSITEQEMQARVQALPAASQGVAFMRQRDGFEFNGQRYLDPEGEIGNYAYNWETGDVTFLVKVAPKMYTLKYTRVTTGSEPINIGTVTARDGSYLLQTVTGKKLSGSQFILSSTGVGLSRGDSAFIYAYGQPIKTLVTPDGWHIAQFQNGDMMSTGYMLLERTVVQKRTSGLGGFFSSVSELGNKIGIGKKSDYTLMSINDTSKQHLINVTLGGKDVETAAYGCRPALNGLAQKCAAFDFSEALYQKNGRRNQNHYFWGIRWFSTDQGPIAVAHEGGGRKIAVYDLNTGKKSLAFDRALGINEYDAVQTGNGQINVQAKLGFSSGQIEDLADWLQSAPAISDDKEPS